jgi:hypothetical protein
VSIFYLQVKNSSTRNLHRLASAIRFIQLLFERLVSGSKPAAAGQEAAAAGVAGNSVTLREAASSAYEEALAPIHTTIVRVSSSGRGDGDCAGQLSCGCLGPAWRLFAGADPALDNGQLQPAYALVAVSCNLHMPW